MTIKRVISSIAALGMVASLVLAQDYTGTVKGTVVRDIRPGQTTFSATKETGPWDKQKEGHKPTVAVVPLGGSPTNAAPFLVGIAQILPKQLSKYEDIEVIQPDSVALLLKEAGLSPFPKGDERLKARDYMLSSYDVTVVAAVGNGWLQIASYHATNKTQALYHGFSTYFGPNPSESDATNAVDSQILRESIDMVLGRAKK